MCVWLVWDQLRCSQTAVPPPLSPHRHFLTTVHKSFPMRNRLNMLCSSVWKNVCQVTVLPVPGWQRQSYTEKNNLFLLVSKSFLLILLLTHVEDVLMATLLVELFWCCFPLHSSMLTSFLTLANKLEQSCCYTLQSASVCLRDARAYFPKNIFIC